MSKKRKKGSNSTKRQQIKNKSTNTFMSLIVDLDQKFKMTYKGMPVESGEDVAQIEYNELLSAISNDKRGKLTEKSISALEDIAISVGEIFEVEKQLAIIKTAKMQTGRVIKHSKIETLVDNPEVYYDLTELFGELLGDSEEFLKAARASEESLLFSYIVALSFSNFELASRLLGWLDKSDSSASLKQYAEALYLYFKKDFQQAIRVLENIHIDSKLYLRSQGLKAECLAYLGDAEKLCELIIQIGRYKFTNSTLIRLKVILCKYSPDGIEANNLFSSIVIGSGRLFGSYDDPDKFFVIRFVLSELIKYAVELEEYMEFIQLTSDEGFNFFDLDHSAISTEVSNIFVGVKNTEYETLFEGKGQSGYLRVQYIIESIETFTNSNLKEQQASASRNDNIEMPPNENMRLEYFILETLYRTGDFIWLKDYLEQRFDTYPDSVQIRLSELVLQAPVEDPNQRKNKLISAVEQKVAQQMMKRKLTPKSRSTIDFADSVLKEMMNSNGLTDAGLVSLGYFKAIETELNERLFAPLMEQLDKELISKLLAENIVWHQSWLHRWVKTNSTNFDVMLGPAFFFFKDVKKEDDELSKYLFDKIVNLLTDKGKEHFLNNDLMKTISPETVKRFRNPPAHTKFLPLDVAIECRDYVESTLASYVEWFNDYKLHPYKL